MKKAVLIVLDSVGAGYLPDPAAYGDVGANTLRHVAESMDLKVPNMRHMGLGHLPGLNIPPDESAVGAWGRAAECSSGKDTTTGHWEIAGVTLPTPFPTFPDGFPEDFLRRWMKAAGVPGYLCNRPISGTVVIKELGEEHLKTGFPIVYTSADSVFQIAAHEERFGLERLYEVCRITRGLVDELNVGRVIARPFVGTKADDFTRTPRRRDYSMRPPEPNLLTHLEEKGLPFYAIGKIEDIYAKVAVTKAVHTVSNRDGMAKVMEAFKEQKNGLIFANLVDFDMLYGHRRDPAGYAKCLEDFDELLGPLLLSLGRNDYLFISADHGLDPTYKGTDHTRERVPLVLYSPSVEPKDLGTRETYADLGATVAEILELPPLSFGRSVLS